MGMGISYSCLMFLIVEIFRTSIEVLSGDMSKLDNQIKKITNQMNNINTEKDVVSQMEEFLPVSIVSCL